MILLPLESEKLALQHYWKINKILLNKFFVIYNLVFFGGTFRSNFSFKYINITFDKKVDF